MSKAVPLVSIVIPVKNGMDTLPKLIEGIQKQTEFENCEVVAIDSGSTDGSVEFLDKFSFVRVITIDPKTFNHGATRNLGVSHAQGEFILLTVQDAEPETDRWIADFVAHFKDDQVMAVCGQQVVPHDKNKNPHEWFRPQSKAKAFEVVFPESQDFLGLSPKEQRNLCGWDDVNAMYRKKALTVLPFEPLMFGEDMLWAKMALIRGFKIVYDYNIRVKHYHYQFPDFTYKRVLIAKFFVYKCFSYVDGSTYSFKDYLLVVYRNLKWKCSPTWIWHNFKIIHFHRNATKAFLDHVENNTLEVLEKELALNIPMGLQKK